MKPLSRLSQRMQADVHCTMRRLRGCLSMCAAALVFGIPLSAHAMILAADGTVVGTFEMLSPHNTIYTAGLVHQGGGSVSGQLFWVNGPNSEDYGCNASDFAGFTVGSIALIARGVCSFADKATHAYDAGAAAAIVYNTMPNSIFVTMDPAFNLDIPVLLVQNDTGIALEAAAFNGPAVMSITLNNVPEPEMLLLFGSALATMVGMRRRKTRQ